jgi:hypothetical protein
MRSAGLPSLNTRSVRILWTPYAHSRAGVIVDVQLHDFELALIVAGNLLDHRRNVHGMDHHTAQKSTRTGCVDCKTSCSNVLSVTSMAFAMIDSLLGDIT